MNELDAIRQIVANYPGGIEVVALRMGKPAETLRKEIAGAQGFKLGIVHALQISTMAIEAQSPHCYAFVNAIAAPAGRMLELPVREMTVAKQDHRDEAAGVVKEGTDVLIELNAALADEQISDNELRRIDKEIDEAQAKLQELRRDAHARNLAGKPAHLRAA
jgi:hypothetical protein